MTPEIEFRSGVLQPIECLKEGWAMIKDRYWLFLGIALVAGLISGAVPVVLVGPMMCGVFLCLLAQMRGEPVEFGMLFKGFDYFMPGLVAAAIQTAPGFVLGFVVGMMSAIVSIALRPGQPDDGPAAGVMIVIVLLAIFATVVAMFIHLLFIFSYPLIVDRKLSGWEAITTSYRAVMKNLGGVVGLILLNAGLMIVGFLCCIIGVYFVLPVTLAAQAVAYRRVFPDGGPVNLSSPPPPPGSWAA